MKTIFVFTTSGDRTKAGILQGIRDFFNTTDWNIQHFEYEGKPFPIHELTRLWSPVGCIVEVSGNDILSHIFPKSSFSRLPVVYLGCDPSLTPKGATYVINDPLETANIASRELLRRHDIRQLAFVGLKSHAWSLRREEAFARAIRLNGKPLAQFNLASAFANRSPAEFNRLRKWLLKLKKPCGLFAADDTIAESVLSASRFAGIAVPTELTVIGVDDNESICDHTLPTLTSIRPDFRQAGRLSARLLARKLLKSTRIPTETIYATSGLTRRSSTRLLLRADAAVSAALDKIYSEGGELLTCAKILKGFSCSRRNAEIRFRQATGHSLLDELIAARVEFAKDLLRNTVLPISEIGIRCGYRAQSRFIAVFKQTTGQSPLKWRQKAC